MSFPTSFSSLQNYTSTTRKRLSARRSSSLYHPLPPSHTTPDASSSSASSAVAAAAPTAAAAAPPSQASSSSFSVPQRRSTGPTDGFSFISHPPSAERSAFSEGRRLSRRLALLSRKSSSSSTAPSSTTTEASQPTSRPPSTTPQSHSPLAFSDDDRLTSGEISSRGIPDSISRSASPLLHQSRDQLSDLVSPPQTGYTTTTTAPAQQSRRPSASHIIPPLEDRRRKLVRSLSRQEHLTDHRGDPSATDPDRKMHQTSSRLLRMTDDDRPFTRDFKDLFSTLMVSLPLSPHRVRFRQIEHTFTSEEAITNLGSLKFSQSNRMPDPKDPSRIVTTTTTTTFSMAKEMARSVCQKFLDARFIESADGKMDFSSKSAVWQLTPKGMHILHRFCLRNGIQQDHVRSLLESPRNTMKLVILEREADTDRLSHDQATVEVIFRRFVGSTPNVKADTTASDSDSLNEYSTGLVGVKVAEDRKVGDRVYKKTFTGKAATDWLMDCCTMVDRRETIEIATLFVEYGLISPIETFPPSNGRFQASKNAIYFITERGQRIAGWIASPQASVNGDAAAANANKAVRDGVVRDSNTNRMQVIVRDPALRLLFREYLRHTHCEENLSFYIDVDEFLTNYRSAKRANSTPKLEFIRETLAAAYSLYNAFLAPGSPCELNIDHTLRIALASRMTRAVGDDEAMIKSLDEVASLFDQAQTTVFKLMATDSVPKFTRDPKYVPILRERNLDFGTAGHPSS